MEYRRPVPEEKEIREGDGQRGHGNVDHARRGGVAEVHGRQLEEVDHDDDLGNDVDAVSPQNNPGEMEQVVSGYNFSQPLFQKPPGKTGEQSLQDKVATDSSRRADDDFVTAEEMPDVHCLVDPKHNPVDGNEDG
jgi:hypothetical protein